MNANEKSSEVRNMNANKFKVGDWVGYNRRGKISQGQIYEFYKGSSTRPSKYLIKLDKALNESATFLDSNYSADVETIAHRSTQTS